MGFFQWGLFERCLWKNWVYERLGFENGGKVERSRVEMLSVFWGRACLFARKAKIGRAHV